MRLHCLNALAGPLVPATEPKSTPANGAHRNPSSVRALIHRRISGVFGMVAIASLVFILFLSLIVVRIAGVALTLTGMSREVARFQARSAWTGTGFTTAESEQVVNHPVRRKIVSFLILLRNAGFVTAGSALVLSFVGVDNTAEGWPRLAVLVVGVVLLWILASSTWVDTRLSRLIAWALKRHGALDTRDYADLLHLAGEYGVMELKVKSGDWLAGHTLGDLALPEEGVLVLAIVRPGGEFRGTPKGHTRVEGGDVLLLYGRSPTLDNLDRRRAGREGRHDRREAIERQRAIEAEEERADATSGATAGEGIAK